MEIVVCVKQVPGTSEVEVEPKEWIELKEIIQSLLEKCVKTEK